MSASPRSASPRRSVARDVDALRERRMRAVELFEAGLRQVEVVTQLGVSAQTASRWYQRWQTGGRDALLGAQRVGGTPRLSGGELAGRQNPPGGGPETHRVRPD